MKRTLRRKRLHGQAGLTLIEVLVAITLLSLLSVGMLIAMQIGLAAFSKTDRKLMDNRRVSGAQRLVEQELEGLMPVVAPCGRTGIKVGFFQGEAQVIRLVSSFSLQQAWRGQPQVLELFVIGGDQGRGVRLVVNEIPYAGPMAAGQLCTGMAPDPITQTPALSFIPVVPGPSSFVLADQLAYCHFAFLSPGPPPNNLPAWTQRWAKPGWPMAVRIDMAPLEPDPSRLQPISVVAPVYIHRSPEIPYADY
ncbi:MAG TPA: prepilin-type N-terminal cleavage/methylation domain-containing protein [Bryobacteraceae bacterium]|nr:prepilin-type N-terminal cleavage/methylation domain-containing protein [Bryobacteraceae bacterium]